MAGGRAAEGKSANSNGGSSSSNSKSSSNTNTGIWLGAVLVGTFGAAYAAVPLYRLFCRVTGFGGTTQESRGVDYSGLQPVVSRPIRVQFNSDCAANMPWKFAPAQREVVVVPGQTALAFFTAENPTDKPIYGISTYNVTPQKMGKYFHKIQCFCFEEQRLNPHESVDMPVFFFIDPAMADDPRMKDITYVSLSYTFFKSREQE